MRSGFSSVVDLAAPAVELDRPHLDAGEDSVGILDIEIILVLPSFSRIGTWWTCSPNEPVSCFWKKHFLARPCGQRTRLIGRRALSAASRGAIAA